MAHDLAIVSHRGRLIRCLWLADLNISMLSLHYVMPNKISFFVMPRQARKGGWMAGTHMRAGYASACIETFETKTSFRPQRTVYWQGFFFLRKQKALSQVSALAKHRKQYGFERWLWRRQLTKQKEAGSFSGKTLIFISEDFVTDFPLRKLCKFYKFVIEGESGFHPNKWELSTSCREQLSLGLSQLLIKSLDWVCCCLLLLD